MYSMSKGEITKVNFVVYSLLIHIVSFVSMTIYSFKDESKYRNYSMFSDTLCFRTPLFLAKIIIFCNSKFSDRQFFQDFFVSKFSDTEFLRCFRAVKALNILLIQTL